MKYRRIRSHLAKQLQTDNRTLLKGPNLIKEGRKVHDSMVYEFYTRDDNSRLTSGKAETITKGKRKEQRRYLWYSLRTLHSKFCSENGEVISYATFCRLRPFYVLFPRMNNRESCVCIKCANLQVCYLIILRHIVCCLCTPLRI
jgi:hypothetical protein